MSKPDWSTAPSWAKYLAMDSDGGWYWYEFAPYIGGIQWVETSATGWLEIAQYSGKGWEDSLEERPE